MVHARPPQPRAREKSRDRKGQALCSAKRPLCTYTYKGPTRMGPTDVKSRGCRKLKRRSSIIIHRASLLHQSSTGLLLCDRTRFDDVFLIFHCTWKCQHYCCTMSCMFLPGNTAHDYIQTLLLYRCCCCRAHRRICAVTFETPRKCGFVSSSCPLRSTSSDLHLSQDYVYVCPYFPSRQESRPAYAHTHSAVRGRQEKQILMRYCCCSMAASL